MEVGIIGLPGSGKSTLFTTLTGQDTAAMPSGGKITVHRGIVKVPDERLDILTDIFKPQKKVNATIEYIEAGGPEQESGPAKGLAPQLIQHLKNTDALCLMVRAFENEYYPHPAGSIDPVRDFNTSETEFILTDLGIIENRINRIKKQVMSTKDEAGMRELSLLERCREALESEKPLRELSFDAHEDLLLRGFQFLTRKPLIIVLNINEQDLPRREELLESFRAATGGKNVTAIALSAKIEQEIAQLEADDAALFLEELNISEPALPMLIRACYELLGLISFFTVGEDECRSWTIRRNTPAQKAAGAIHTDLERGFIRAEVIHYEDFMSCKSIAKCRDKGLLRLEGKEYIVQDGDILNIRFNV